ncbi:MAG: nucleoside recognition protein [bacterium]|nr:nucleoside recognition protein [bacterium]
MGYIWVFLIVVSVIVGIANGRLVEVTQAIGDSAKLAVEISISLIGVMAFWLGIVKLAEKSGIVKLISKLVKPITDFLFPEIPAGHSALGNIAMNVTANALGVTNAATPIGIKAMEEMQTLNPQKDTATNPMCTFLAINTAGFQLIPASVIAVLVASGSTNPTEIIAPTILVTLFGTIVAIIAVKILQNFFPMNKTEEKDA